MYVLDQRCVLGLARDEQLDGLEVSDPALRGEVTRPTTDLPYRNYGLLWAYVVFK